MATSIENVLRATMVILSHNIITIVHEGMVIFIVHEANQTAPDLCIHLALTNSLIN